ncbi:MAG: alpha-L-fucosidase, partial [Planctomycetota bacterium]
KRDVVGELEKAIKKRNMKFVTAFHHAANWFFFPVKDKRYDTGDPKYSGLYGQPHEEGAMRNQAFIDEWYGKIIEVIDKYSPDFIWFDFALDSIPEGYVVRLRTRLNPRGLRQGLPCLLLQRRHEER